MDTKQSTTLKPDDQYEGKLPTHSFTARSSLIRRVQNRANQMHDGNRSAMIVEFLEKGLEAAPLERPSP